MGCDSEGDRRSRRQDDLGLPLVSQAIPLADERTCGEAAIKVWCGKSEACAAVGSFVQLNVALSVLIQEQRAGGTRALSVYGS